MKHQKGGVSDNKKGYKIWDKTFKIEQTIPKNNHEIYG